MRRGLSGVRSRVDRLARRLRLSAQAGCAACRGKEDTPRVLVYYGDARPDIPESRCEACGRVIPSRHFFIGYSARMNPPETEEEKRDPRLLPPSARPHPPGE